MRSKSQHNQQEQYRVSIFSGKQSLKFRALVALWAATLIWFWSWVIQSDHIASLSGAMLTFFVLMCTTVLPGWFFYFVMGAKRPNDKLPLPQGTIGIFITKVPSEPFDKVIKKTLKAVIRAREVYYRAHNLNPMLNAQFVRIFLCDENPEHDTNKYWCQKHGITIISRKDVDGYHNAIFPFRQRTKEGNLGYAYNWLYSQGMLPDFLVQFDSDHVPTESYLVEIMRPFIDPSIGYVAAPSICNANTDESWLVRARLFAEAIMHGALQAGYFNHGWAPNPIGSHYTLRSAAFLELEHPVPQSMWSKVIKIVRRCLGPELAEDFTTGLAMNANGWRGAFAINAIASGDGAGSFADSMTQEFQWSRSLMVVLLKWTPRYFRSSHLTLRHKVQYMFTQVWYPLFSAYMLIGMLLPPFAVLRGMPWLDVRYFEWLAHSLPLMAACTLPVLYLGRLGWLRPDWSPNMAWETVVFQFVRWPWALWGCVHAVIGTVILNRELPFKVTPKGVTTAKPLPMKVLSPYFLIVLVQTLPVLLTADAGEARGYAWLCLVNAVTYLGIIVLVIWQHAKENKVAIEGSPVKFYLRPIMVVMFVAIIVVASLVSKGPEAAQAMFFEGQAISLIPSEASATNANNVVSQAPTSEGK